MLKLKPRKNQILSQFVNRHFEFINNILMTYFKRKNYPSVKKCDKGFDKGLNFD
jgi:hypothetical protein